MSLPAFFAAGLLGLAVFFGCIWIWSIFISFNEVQDNLPDYEEPEPPVKPIKPIPRGTPPHR